MAALSELLDAPGSDAGRQLAFDRAARAIELRQGRPAVPEIVHTDPPADARAAAERWSVPLRVAVSGDGSRLLLGSVLVHGSTVVKLRRAGAAAPDDELPYSGLPRNRDVVLDRTGTSVVAARDSSVEIAPAEDGAGLRGIPVRTAPSSVAVRPDGTIAVGEAAFVALYDAKSSVRSGELPIGCVVSELAVPLAGSTIGWGCSSGSAGLARSDGVRIPVAWLDSALLGVGFSADGRFFVGAASEVVMFEPRTGATKHFPSKLRASAFAVASSGVFAIASDSAAHLFDPATDHDVAEIRGFRAPVVAMAFGPRDRALLLAAGELVHVFSMVHGEETATLRIDDALGLVEVRAPSGAFELLEGQRPAADVRVVCRAGEQAYAREVCEDRFTLRGLLQRVLSGERVDAID